MKLAFLLFVALAMGQETKIPLLGPGADKLSQEEYLKIYRLYIQQSMLLEYPFSTEAPQACDQAIKTIFRQAGFFDYPVPQTLDRAERGRRSISGGALEFYLLGGQIIQLERAENKALVRLLWVNSSAPKATKLLWGAAKKKPLSLARDPITGLERLQNIPVGFQHAYLDQSSQGLYVREMRFNGKLDACEPISYTDNNWAQGFRLDAPSCSALRSDINKVWEGKLRSGELAENEREKFKSDAIAASVARGNSKESAQKILDQIYVSPFSHDITVVGSAMRRLNQCNLLAIGFAGSKPLAPKPATPPSAAGNGATSTK